MIAFVDGEIDYIGLDHVVIDVGGVGYNVNISADTAARLPGIGEHIRLYTYTCVREDAFLLYGFLSRNDLEIFRKCISVNGIGPKGALSILSVMDADTLRFAILSGDTKAISKAPGIGAKTAERLVLELRDKVKTEDTSIGAEISLRDAVGDAKSALAETPEKKEALAALVSLGYGQAESMRAVNAVENSEHMDAGAILKAALKKMF